MYCIPESIFHDFCARYEVFADFVEVEDSTRLKQAVESKNDDGNDLTTSKVKTLLTRDAVILPNTSSIQSVAKIMAEENISAALISDPDIDDEQNSSFVGIITERDLCAKVIASGLSVDTPVSEVMSTETYLTGS